MEEAGAAKAKGTEAPSPTTTAMASTSSSWVVEMEKLLGVSEGGSSGQSSVVAQMVRQQEGHSIYRVPEYIKDMTNRKAYEPQLVSLGPFHYGEPPLLPMEVHKRRAVAHMVNRSGKPLQKFVSAVEEISEQLRNAYENLDETKWPEQRFVELMVTDGWIDYGPKDPVFSQHGWLHVLDHIMSDMVVMENQVPLLLIKKLMFVAQDTYDFQVIRPSPITTRNYMMACISCYFFHGFIRTVYITPFALVRLINYLVDDSPRTIGVPFARTR